VVVFTNVVECFNRTLVGQNYARLPNWTLCPREWLLPCLISHAFSPSKAEMPSEKRKCFTAIAFTNSGA
jgi:hypothetical protein